MRTSACDARFSSVRWWPVGTELAWPPEVGGRSGAEGSPCHLASLGARGPGLRNHRWVVAPRWNLSSYEVRVEGGPCRAGVAECGGAAAGPAGQYVAHWRDVDARVDHASGRFVGGLAQPRMDRHRRRLRHGPESEPEGLSGAPRTARRCPDQRDRRLDRARQRSGADHAGCHWRAGATNLRPSSEAGSRLWWIGRSFERHPDAD